MKTSHRGKVVVVTGASAGVGRAVVAEFARHGALIGLIARGRERLEATKREVEKLGGKALVLPTDVADAQQVEEAAKRTEQELGPIDIWVDNAMTHHLRAVSRNYARRIQARDGSDLSGASLRNDGGAEANALAQWRHYRTSRFGSGLSVHSAAIALLWR